MLLFSFLFLFAATVFGLPLARSLPARTASGVEVALQLSTRQQDVPSRRSKRADLIDVGEQASVYVCEDVFWGGKCETKTYNLGSDECVELDGKASSIRPDPGFHCVFFKNAVCRDFSSGKDSITLADPGNANLFDTDEGNWNDQIRGFQCFKSE